MVMAKQENDKGVALARHLDVQIPTDREIVTREIVQLADVILEIARHEASGASVLVVSR